MTSSILLMPGTSPILREMLTGKNNTTQPTPSSAVDWQQWSKVPRTMLNQHFMENGLGGKVDLYL